MPTSLSDSITSSYIEHLQYFRSINSPIEILVYVEDDIDICFWDSLLNCASPNGRYHFNIQVIKSNNKSIFGKSYLLGQEKMPQYGPYLWACVDSDYDNILDNGAFHIAMTNPYIIGTIAYSIENFKCHPNNIKQCVKTYTLSSSIVFDVDDFMSYFSFIIFNLFTIHLTSEYLKDGVYGISSFSDDINRLTYSNTYKVKWREILDDIVSSHESYINEHRLVHEKILAILQSNNINRNNLYLYIQGHALMNFIVKNIVLVGKKIISSRVAELIKNNSKGEVEKYRKQVYRNQSRNERVRQILDDSNNVEICPMFELVAQKVLKALPT